MKIQLFELGTLFILKKGLYRLEIATNKVLAERVEDLTELKEEHPYFFTLKDIKRENDRLILGYEMEDGYQPLQLAKSYSTVLQLALLNQLLELDPLHTFNQKVLIHPRNIFFKDMKKLKFLYRSNQWLPFEGQIEKLEQYKILTLSMFSRFSYEKYRREKENLLKKETDEFFFRIENASSVEDLKELIANKLQEEEMLHFFGLEEERQKIKRQKRILTGMTIGISAVVFTLALFLQQMAVKEAETAYATELEKAEQTSTFYKLLSEDKYDDALSLLKKTGGSKKEFANLYFEKGEYQQAIEADDTLIKPSVEALYKANRKEEILGLVADSDYLDIEKKIVSYDYSMLLSMQAFTKDKDQQLRIGKAFAEHGDLTDANDLNKRLKNKDLTVMIRKKELQNQVTQLEQQIKHLKKKKGVKPKDIKEQLDPKNKELTTYKTELDKLDKKSGFN
ncbi:WXG100 protein secretion system (Wss), protein YukC [Peribacillus simplex]|uniref:WXG100 protein secretion system (Wss), protein YukC n=1 Tax=Peribacillus simplex TaxID=1478 RepID=A0A9X8RDN0_9BACI|nr:type VII secretion protein EssB/YukC [Peribacillus simplex]SIS01821.1 WXG100 protein secretion system (Wss), protein YukC [Peribacillus simplex]